MQLNLLKVYFCLAILTIHIQCIGINLWGHNIMVVGFTTTYGYAISGYHY
jgi:hypothetical protein